MRKLIGLLVILICFMSSTCLASISTKDDEFTGGKIISSEVYEHNSLSEAESLGHMSSFKFDKIIAKNNMFYQMELVVNIPEGGRVQGNTIFMNIDGKTYTLNIVNRYKYGEQFAIVEHCIFNITDEMVNDLKSAERVAFKASVVSPRYRNISSYTVEGVSVAPQKALDEWKEVIATVK